MDIVRERLFTIPNTLSLFRIAITPIMLIVVLFGDKTLFLFLFLGAALSDILDGFLARKMGQVSSVGSKLDCLGDIGLIIFTTLGLWQLFPEIFRKEAVYIILLYSFGSLPFLFDYLKFRKLSCYHTYSDKVGALLLGFSVSLFFILPGAGWHVRFVVFYNLFASLDNLIISSIMTEHKCDVPTFWHALKLRKYQKNTPLEQRITKDYLK